MKSIRSIGRSFARARFATVLPAAAFALGLILSITFTVFYFVQAKTTHELEADAQGRLVAQLLVAELIEEDLSPLEAQFEGLLAGRAELLGPDGDQIAGTIEPEFKSKARPFELRSGDTALGTLWLTPVTEFKPPMPYWLAGLLCLVCAAFAAFVMQLFAKMVGRYIAQVTTIVNDYSLTRTSSADIGDLAFSEFKRLGLATLRTSRRVASELASLRAGTLIDERTGLFNERAFQAEIESTLSLVNYTSPAALITLEFQVQSQGQERVALGLPSDAYVEAAKRLKQFATECGAKHGHERDSWVLASLFSDQFAILIKDSGSRDDVATIIRELLGEFRVPLRVSDQTLSVYLNGSIVILPEDGSTLTQITDRAQATIDDLKRQERTGFSFYSPKLERQRDAKIKLETELRQAVAEDRFIPLFQPKIDLRTGMITGVEALARWELENGRLVSPSVFIELAEETSLINKIGSQIMRKACQAAADWSVNGQPINLAVNVSPRQFENDLLAETILDALAKSGLPPRQFEIEITESLAIHQPERVRSVLRPLRRLGIKLAVDDFGTGHSNLAVLTQLDFDVFKIDRQFLEGTPDDPHANAIVEMILSMAKTLNMSIVGEGIETPEQARFLTERGCHIGQGYLYSPPVTAEAFSKLVETQPFMPQKLSA